MKKNHKKAVLVTGGAGFIGSHVVDELIIMNKLVVVVDDLSGGFIENINKKAIFVRGDISDANFVKKLFKKYSFEYVFHLAAYAAEGLSHFIKHFNYTNNLIGSINLINASVNSDVKCFVFTSSIAVYGTGQTPMKENMNPLPEDSYGIAKYAIELELKSTKEMFGMNYIIFRPHNVYGERQNIGDKYRNVIGIFINKIMQGETIPVFGDGLQKRAFTHIDDVAPVIARSIANSKIYNQVFNLGADKPYTINDLIYVVSKEMGVNPMVTYHKARKEVRVAHSDHAKAKKFFGYRPKIDLNTGIKRMVVWAKKTGSKKSKRFDHIEILKNLPPFWLS